MKTIISTLTSIVSRLFGFRRPKNPTGELSDPIRTTCLELEGARARFDQASRHVTRLTQYIEQARKEGLCNRGFLALLQRDLNRAGRKAQTAFDDTIRLQDDLAVLENVNAGRSRMAHGAPISREAIENLLREVAIAESRLEKFHEVARELDEVVNGNRDFDASRMEILQTPEPFVKSSTCQASVSKPCMMATY